MEKQIDIEGKKITLKNTCAFLLNYKEQFGSDVLKDIFSMKSNTSLNVGMFYNIIWSLAKTAKYDIEPPEQWLGGFDKLSFVRIIPEVMDMILSCLSSSSTKTETNESSDFTPTTELILASGIKRGLCLMDFNRMTIGMILDYIYAYDDKEDERIIEATQKDFDGF